MTTPTQLPKKSPTSGQGLLIFLCVISALAAVNEPSSSIQASIVFAAAFVSIFLLEILRAVSR